MAFPLILIKVAGVRSKNNPLHTRAAMKSCIDKAPVYLRPKNINIRTFLCIYEVPGNVYQANESSIPLVYAVL